MKLHEAPDHLDFIQTTANHLGIPAVHVEKDYWVTRVLKRLRESAHCDSVVFKGGTSLSKAHHLIHRFSEDIDLALRRDDDLTNSGRRTLIRTIEREITADLEYRPSHPEESKHGRFRKTAHAFPIQSNAAELGHVSDTLLVEINSFASPERSSPMQIATLIHDFLVETGRQDLVHEHDLDPFDIHVLDVERTLCEKIMSLVRAGHGASPDEQFRRRIRHFYDLVMILRESRYREFVMSDTFPDLIAEVKKSDLESMPDAKAWLDQPLREAAIATEPASLWRRISPEFRGNFRDMVYGDSLPDDREVVKCLALVGASLARIS